MAIKRKSRRDWRSVRDWPGYPRRQDQYSTAQLAKILHCAVRTVYSFIDSGKLRCTRLPGSPDRRVVYADLIAFLERYPDAYGDVLVQLAWSGKVTAIDVPARWRPFVDSVPVQHYAGLTEFALANENWPALMFIGGALSPGAERQLLARYGLRCLAVRFLPEDVKAVADLPYDVVVPGDHSPSWLVEQLQLVCARRHLTTVLEQRLLRLAAAAGRA